MAYEEGGAEPSAYDMVFLCNFLTQQNMTKRFERNRFESSQATHLNRAVGLYFGLLV